MAQLPMAGITNQLQQEMAAAQLHSQLVLMALSNEEFCNADDVTRQHMNTLRSLLREVDCYVPDYMCRALGLLRQYIFEF